MNRLPAVLAAGVVLLSACTSSRPVAAPSTAPSTEPPSASATAPSASAAPSGTTSPAPTGVASPSPARAANPPCATASLRLTIGSTDSGAGQSHQQLVLTNRGAGCSLRGYPGVSFLDAAGRQLGSPAQASGRPIGQVLLAPGGRAVAVLTYSNAGAYPDSTCRPAQASQVRVYPPNQLAALTAPDPILVCSAPGSGQLRIDPVGPA